MKIDNKVIPQKAVALMEAKTKELQVLFNCSNIKIEICHSQNMLSQAYQRENFGSFERNSLHDGQVKNDNNGVITLEQGSHSYLVNYILNSSKRNRGLHYQQICICPDIDIAALAEHLKSVKIKTDNRLKCKKSILSTLLKDNSINIIFHDDNSKIPASFPLGNNFCKRFALHDGSLSGVKHDKQQLIPGEHTYLTTYTIDGNGKKVNSIHITPKTDIGSLASEVNNFLD